MIKPFSESGELLGLRMQTEYADFVFGGKNLTRGRLERDWNQYAFHLLRQVHGVAIETAPFTGQPQADGVFTTKPGLALTVQTADCVPILLANSKAAAALHAGWRGAAGQIVKESARLFAEPPTVAAIGPHIQWRSFEIGREVVEPLLASAPAGLPPSSLLLPHQNPSKAYFNLRGLIEAQLKAVFPKIQIFSSDRDTLTDSEFHSYRRNGANAGRQFSFVVLKA